MLSGIGPSGKIKLSKGETVFDDEDLDRLFGSCGKDWYFMTEDEERRLDRRRYEESN
jgi:hypothetical protein